MSGASGSWGNPEPTPQGGSLFPLLILAAVGYMFWGTLQTPKRKRKAKAKA